MDKNLQFEIQAAREAAGEIARIDALREQAEDLPRLEQELRQKQREAFLAGELEQACQNAAKRLGEIKQKTSTWRQRYQSALSELEELSSELPDLQRAIQITGFELRKAVSNLYYSKNPQPDPLTSDIPPEMLEGNNFDELWQQAGGLDLQLDCFPPDATPGSLAEMISDRIKKYARTFVYTHTLGTRYFRR